VDYPEAKDPLEIGRPKTASGIIVYLMEELGDARLRCAQLKQYIKTAQDIIDKSEEKDHIFEVASHLIQGIPDALFRLDKALDAAALGAARLDYEEIKQGLKPEKVDELEEVLKDVRLHYLKRRSDEPVTTKKAADTLDRVADTLELTGELPLVELLGLAASLESQSKMASEGLTPRYLRAMATAVRETPNPSRQHLAQAVRVLVAEGLACGKGAGAGEDFQKENPKITDEQAAKIDEEHEKNKDVVKDKSAADDKALKIKKDDTFSSGVSGHDYPGSFFEIPGLSDRDGKVLAKIVGNMLPNGWEAEWLGSKNMLEASPKDTSAEYGPDAYRDWVSSGDHNRIKRVIEKFLEDLAPKGKTAVDTTKEEWQEALRRDEALLKKLQGDVKKLEQGEEVENLTLANAKKAIQSLTEVIKNKKALLSKLASEDVTMDWNTLISRYASSEQSKAASEDDKQSRFEEGKPADPTENMSPEDAKKWKEMHDKYKDTVKDKQAMVIQGGRDLGAFVKDVQELRASYKKHSKGIKNVRAQVKADPDWDSMVPVIDKLLDSVIRASEDADALERLLPSEYLKAAAEVVVPQPDPVSPANLTPVFGDAMVAEALVKLLDSSRKANMAQGSGNYKKMFFHLLGVIDAVGQVGKAFDIKSVGLLFRVWKEYAHLSGARPTTNFSAAIATEQELAEEARKSRFEEGKPADPTENMSPEDAKKWKEEHDKNKDNFKAAGAIKPLDEAKKGDRVEFTYKGEKLIGKVIRVKKDGVVTVDPENSSDEDLGWVDIHPSKKTAAEDDKESRFEEGKPADPTENMSPEDAKKWKEEHDKNKDNFKA
jgi:hypothetical protein